jgi:hypothetical protein
MNRTEGVVVWSCCMVDECGGETRAWEWCDGPVFHPSVFGITRRIRCSLPSFQDCWSTVCLKVVLLGPSSKEHHANKITETCRVDMNWMKYAVCDETRAIRARSKRSYVNHSPMNGLFRVSDWFHVGSVFFQCFPPKRASSRQASSVVLTTFLFFWALQPRHRGQYIRLFPWIPT